MEGGPKTGYFPENSNVYFKQFMHISEYVSEYSLQKSYFRNNGITWHSNHCLSLFKLRTFRTGKKELHRGEELTQRNNKKMERLNNYIRTSVHVDIPQLHN